MQDNGIHHVTSDGLPAWFDQAQARGWTTRRVNLTHCRDKATLMTTLADTLALPAHFGGNWDALADCLCDLAWLGETPGLLLVLDQSEALAAESPALFETLSDILETAGAFWQDQSWPFQVCLA